MSPPTEDSQTAQDYLASQLQLEADAREALPYQFDTCTRPLGPLRQSLFSCLTCNPPPTDSDVAYSAAALCYSCSISCHGEHNLVELFTKRNFECDCGTSRLPSSAPCTLRLNSSTGQKTGVTGESPRRENEYNHNFAGRFCACGEEYDPTKEKGTMFQCLGLGHVHDGGCGEDWWHPECLMGLPRTTPLPEIGNKTEEDQEDPPLPLGFPEEDEFDHLICYKCVNSNPWIKQYAASPGFLKPVFYNHPSADTSDKPLDGHADVVVGAAVEDTVASTSHAAVKRKTENDHEDPELHAKKAKTDQEQPTLGTETAKSSDAETATKPKHASLPSPPQGTFSVFLKEDFRDHFCRCPECFPRLAKHPQLLEEEEAYEPPMSETGQDEANGRGSIGSGSTYERGEALLSNVDRVRAIEGVMVYNQLRDKVKSFLQPFAESGQAVGAEDIKAYFEKLRGDDQAIKLAAAGAGNNTDDNNDNRKEQSGQ